MKGGVDKMLLIREDRGRKARIANDSKEECNQFVTQLQKDRQGDRITGEDVVNMIEDKYNASYSVSGVYKVLKRMGISRVQYFQDFINH